MRSHGWSGDLPVDNEDAVRRILDAARACIDREGWPVSIAEVAREIGVTRATVYRYFPTTDALLFATATGAIGDFLARVEAHLERVELAPAEMVVECVAFTLEELPNEPYLGLLYEAETQMGVFNRDFTSPISIARGRLIIDQIPVDWAAQGFDESTLNEFVEFLLRIIQSLMIDPGTPPRTGPELRNYLTRWLGPAVRSLSGSLEGATAKQ
jgi:AcrR family transcriptional regulator